MQPLVRKLTSRKFIMAVAGVLIALGADEEIVAAVVAAAYMVVEGYIDSKAVS